MGREEERKGGELFRRLRQEGCARSRSSSEAQKRGGNKTINDLSLSLSLDLPSYSSPSPPLSLDKDL